jgi:hypothetical protein
MFTRQITQQAVSFVLALAATVVVMGSIDGLAAQPTAEALLAAKPAPALSSAKT